jgi:ATP-dependent Clp protease, protease subunit
MEILVYGGIESYSVANWMQQIESASADEDLTLRINTNGGSPEYGWGLIAKFQEFTGAKKVKIDGKAFSMGGFTALYADEVEALDVSEIMIHRAAYPEWFEKSEYFTEDLKANLVRMNKNLETAFRNRVDVDAFEQMKAIKVKDVFSMDSRKDVFLTAQEAKKIGLVTKINKITPSKRAELVGFVEAAAKFGAMEIPLLPEVSATEPEPITDNQKSNKMTVEEFKAKHPEAYAAVYNAGVTAERDRCGAWMTFVEVDAKAVKEGVTKGDTLSQTAMAELSMKALNQKTLGKVEEETAANASAQTEKTTPPVDASNGQESEADKLRAEIAAKLGIDKK